MKKVVFPLKKVCKRYQKGRFALRFKAKKGDFEKNTNFELEICVKTKKGRTALQPEALLSLK